MAASHKLKTVRLTTPVSNDDLKRLSIGTIVYLTGLIYTGREGVYEKVIAQGHPPPQDAISRTNVNFHCSPAASVNEDGSYSIGAVTATASFRFAKWMKEWFAVSGAKMIIGKGGMSQKSYKDLFVPAGAVYLSTVGYGTGALLGRGIKAVHDVHWLDELGIAQAMWVIEVKDFGPLLVDGDLDGNSLFDANNREIAKGFDKLYEDLKRPAMSRYGETDDRSDELI